jgi:antitoxin component of RelBE/YafQ-DinJ toxin-antitoxin module
MAAKKKARSVVVTLRLSEEEHRLFKRVADHYGLTVASVLRMLIKREETK